MANVDPWIGEVPADNRYVTVDGDDIIPDMMIGRLPVNSASEAQTVVDKIVDYEERPFFGRWSGTVSLVADNIDPAGDFAEHSDTIIEEHLPTAYSTVPIYHFPNENDVSDVSTKILQSWDNGNGMIFYNGHSSSHQWGGERFFHLDDVSSLNNGGRLPVVLQLTCLTGSFHRSDFPTLDEALLRRAGGGAVAVWGATGLGVATGHEILAAGYLDSLFGGNPVIGTAVLAGKINVLTQSPSNNELIENVYAFRRSSASF